MSTETTIQSIARRVALGILKAIGGRRQGLPRLRRDELRRVLLVRYDRIGDAVITTPLIAALKELAPDVEIDVLASPANRVVFDNDPRISRVLIWRSSPAGMLRAIGRARARRYDAVFQLLFSRTTLPALLSGLMAPRGRTIGKSSPGHDFLFNYATETPQQHFGDRTLALLAAGMELDTPLGTARYSLPIPARHRSDAERVLADAGLSAGGYVLLNISAGTRERELTDEQNETILRRLADGRYDLAVIGGPGEAARVAAIARLGGGARPLMFPSLMAAAVAVESARMLITPDTSMVHIAGAVGTPVVAMFPRGGDPTGWGPKEVPHRVVRADHGELLSEIDIEAVIDAATELLKELRGDE